MLGKGGLKEKLVLGHRAMQAPRQAWRVERQQSGSRTQRLGPPGAMSEMLHRGVAVGRGQPDPEPGSWNILDLFLLGI